MTRTVAIGFLGLQLDVGRTADRWQKWRPTVALCQQDDLVLHRYDLLYPRSHAALLEIVTKDIKSVSPETEVVAHEVDFRDPWDFEEVYGKLFDFAAAYAFLPEHDYLLNITTGTHVAQICLFLLAESRRMPARLIQGVPGPRTSIKGGYQIIDLDLARYDHLARRYEREAKDSRALLKSGIATRNEAFNAMIDELERVAANADDPILLLGPTGAGKSQLARQIYALKKARRRFPGPLVEVNCATLRGDQAMSALFGHVKGAFTGALAAREGLLRAAHEGLLFLDEIGELGLDEQAMLLRALEEKRFLPVGADREASSAFTLVAGTNRDLQSDVERGRFREDLLARINVWTFRLPALRERREDIETNFEYELERVAERRGGERVRLTTEARAAFLAFARTAEWRANFRDLGAAAVRLATLAKGGRVGVEDIAAETQRLQRSWQRSAQGASTLTSHLTPEQLAAIDPFDQPQLLAVIETLRASRSLSEAGRALFAVSRQQKSSVNDADRLRKYLARFGLTGDAFLR